MTTSCLGRRVAASAVILLPLVVVGPIAAAAVDAAPPALSYVLPSFTAAGGPTPVAGAGVSLVVGDFDGDATSDVLVPNINRQGAVVLLGTGTGTLEVPVITPLPSAASVVAAAAAQIDGDGRLDVVAATITDAGPVIRVLLGRGDGTFDVGQASTPVGNSIVQVSVADVDGDGRVDYAVAERSNLTGGVIQVALGRGDGTFKSATNYTPAMFISPSDLDLADVDGDGAPDLVYLQGCPVARLNAGDGTFGAEICSTDPEGRIGGVSQVLADFDEDGALDLATGDASGGHVTISRGDGAGRFTFLKQYAVAGNQVNWVTTADFTGDGHLDIAASADAYFAAPTRVIVVLRGSGTGAFGRRAYYATGGDGLAPIKLDADRKIDLVASGLRTGAVSSTLNQGRGVLRAPLAYKGTQAPAVSTIAVSGDLNGDGRDDAVSVSFGVVYARLTQADGRLGARIRSVGSGEILSLQLADVNDDGKLDVIAGSHAPKNVMVMLGRGDGHFGRAKTFNNGSGASALGVAVGDVTGDGVPDIVSNTFAELSVAAGVGDGTFATTVLSGVASGDQPATLLLDVTGDGATDAVSVIRTGTNDDPRTRVTVNEGSGDGTFSAGQTVIVDTRASEGAVADIAGDGSGDVVLVGNRGSHSGRTGLFVLGTVGGQLTTASYYGGPGGGLGVADLNGDAKSDVATVGSSQLELFLGRGSGTLLEAGDLPAGPDATDVAALRISAERVDVLELDGGNPEQLVKYENAAP